MSLKNVKITQEERDKLWKRHIELHNKCLDLYYDYCKAIDVPETQADDLFHLHQNFFDGLYLIDCHIGQALADKDIL